jgi:hypothetical protein
MLKKSRVWLLVACTIVLITVAPASAILAGQGQTPENLIAENMIGLTTSINYHKFGNS